MKLFDWTANDGMSVNVWDYSDKYPDSVMVVLDLEHIGEVGLRLSTQQGENMMEQLQLYYESKKELEDETRRSVPE